MTKNGEVDFMLSTNDARGDKGPIGLGLPFFNEYRSPNGGAAGWPLFNDKRATGMDSGQVVNVGQRKLGGGGSA